jgi:hypothetical protein
MYRLISFIIFLSITWSGFAQIGGDHTYQFLTLTPSAKIASLGGNQVVDWGNNLDFADQNPAMLNDQMSGHFSLNFVGYYAGIKFGNVAYAHTFKKYGTFALNIKSINYGDFLYADVNGDTFGTFGASETSYGIAWSYPIDSVLHFGVNLKGITSQLESYYSNGAAVDFGVIYHKKSKQLTAGVVFKNVGSQFRTYYTEAENEPLPFEIELAISKRLAHAPFRIHVGFQHLEQLDLSYEDPANPSETENPLTGEIEKESKFKNYSETFLKHFIVGAEFLPTENFYISVAYNAQRRAEMKIDTHKGLVGFSWGFGLNVSKFRFGYAQTRYHLAGPSHHFSFGTNLSQFYSKA